PCTIDRFRPNIVLDGLEPWAEDGLPAIRIGEVKIDLSRPCNRCGVPNIDQSTGVAEEFGNLQILSKRRLLKNYRGKPGAMFGVQGVCTSGIGKAIHVGDAIQTANLDPSLPALPRVY
ncbi:MAG TPA: hypothetical protein VNI20_03250, partial [Fimbriimonadaceae bacterium]|nr:hypothetical protein [Fimbriimonadaceae bacterium]